MRTPIDTRPWYREPWPWLLIAGPAVVVAAAVATLCLAVASDDGLVVDDYYKRGLAINQVLARDQLAAERGYSARMEFAPGFDQVKVILAGRELPPVMLLSLTHPTRRGEDRVVPLMASGAGVYEAALAPPSAGRWQITVEDGTRAWRLTSSWQVPRDTVLELGVR